MFPVVEFQFSSSLSSLYPTNSDLVPVLLANIASACGVSDARVVLLRLSDPAAGGVCVFTVTAAWSATDIAASEGVRTFLQMAADASSALYRMDALQHAAVGTAKLGADQTLGTALTQISFGLSYQMSALPLGSAAAFQVALALDLSRVCGVSLAGRIRMLSLKAGSVVSSFLIAPPLSSGDISVDTAIDNFIGAARDTSSALYNQTQAPMAFATIRDSVRVQFPGAPGTPQPTPAPSSDDGFWTERNIIIISAAGGGGLLLIAVCFGLGVCRKVQNDKKKATASVTLTLRPALDAGSGAPAAACWTLGSAWISRSSLSALFPACLSLVSLSRFCYSSVRPVGPPSIPFRLRRRSPRRRNRRPTSDSSRGNRTRPSPRALIATLALRTTRRTWTWSSPH